VAKGSLKQPRNAAYVVLPITMFALAKSKILICWTGQSGVVIVVLRDTINSRARMRAYILHRELQIESTVHDWNDEQGGPRP
jgi:diadenosine tetraphosphatase ApaH/serine/threonine PP2A family protein phosphatase